MLRALCLVLGAVFAAAGCRNNYAEDALLYQEVLGATEAQRGPVLPAELSPEASVTVREAMTLTNLHNERLGLEGEAYVQAIINKQRARAEFLPTLGVFPRYTRRAGDTSQPRDEFETSAVVSYEPFDGFRDVANLYRVAATIEERRALLLNLQADILLETAQVFFDAVGLEQAVEVLQNTSALQDARVRDIMSRRDAGLARALDVSQAQAQAATTRSTLVAARNDVRNARTALTLLTGVDMTRRPLVDQLQVPDAVVPMDEWKAVALNQRHDVRAADARLEAARHNVEIAFGQYYPSVTLDLEYLLTVDNVATEHGWNAILRANVPIFTAGRIEADVRTAWSELRQAKLSASLVRRQVIRDVERAHQTFESTGEQVLELERRIAAAELALRQAEASYDAGLATNLERLTAQDELLAARLDLLTQQFTHKIAYLALLRAAGRLQDDMGVGATAAARGVQQEEAQPQ